MLQSIIKQLGINETLWTQLAIFTGLYLVLRFFFFGPYLKLIELRERESVGAEKDSEKLNLDAEALEAERAAKVAQAKKVAKEKRDAIVTKAQSEAGEKIGAARMKSKEQIEKARAELTSAAASEGGGETQAGAVADLFVEKLLNAKVTL